MIPDNYKPIRQVGNGKTTSFSFDFPMLSENFIKVYREKDGIQELVDPSEYVWGYLPVEGDEPAEDLPPENVITFYEAPEEGTVIVIAREIPLEQTTPYKTSSGFPAVRVEDNFDKLTAITQQLMEEVDRCVKVEITGDQTSEELLAEVYGKLDSATEVAQEAVDAATAATEAVASAEKTLAEVNTYVDESKAEINALITKTTEEIDQTISDATEEIKEVAVDAANEAVQETIGASVIEAATSAEHARIWAEGEQAEVKPLGGELSSMGAADLAYALANAPEDTPIDASGLFAMNVVKGEKGDKGDKGDAGKDGKDGADGKSVFDGYATNCITEIPQDIKLELNNGTLTLKAGSKVYVPNGAGKFDEVTTASDILIQGNDASSEGVVKKLITISTANNTYEYRYNLEACYSGATAPTNIGTHSLWYDTANNIIKRTTDGGATWISDRKICLPLGVFTREKGAPTSIDQVFNGFGYIGSTVFALPGVKGLIPDGRNEDGSLKNVEFTLDGVKTATIGSSDYEITLALYSDGHINTTNAIYTHYDEENNYFYTGSLKLLSMSFGSGYGKAGVVTSFQPKLPFHAVDYSDSSWVSAQGMPSDKFIDLTLGASGSTYTAPANGWFYLGRGATAAGQLLDMFNSTSRYRLQGQAVTNGSYCLITVPARKGDVVKINYNLAGTIEGFRFIYCEGEN